MNLSDLRCVSENVNIDDYLELYQYVLDNMEHPEWLGTFTREEIINFLNGEGKIWLYYSGNNMVCSMFYLPVYNKTLRKHHIEYVEELTGSLGPIMVSPDYVGNGLQMQMMQVFNEYCKRINKKYIFTKVHSDNIYCLKNVLKDGYIKTNEYENERGMNTTFIKEL